MKKGNIKLKGIILVTITLILGFCMTIELNAVTTSSEGYKLLEDDTSELTPGTGTNTGTGAGTTNSAGTTSGTSTGTKNTTAAPTTLNTSNKVDNTSNLPKTGAEDFTGVFIIVAVSVISAVFAYRKFKDYNELNKYLK